MKWQDKQIEEHKLFVSHDKTITLVAASNCCVICKKKRKNASSASVPKPMHCVSYPAVLENNAVPPQESCNV